MESTDAGRSHDPARHYDRVTEAWDLLLGANLHYGLFRDGRESLEHATEELTSEMIRQAELEPGLRVLDVGCGTGAPACRLAADHGVTVVGISTSEVGVDAARERAAEHGLTGRASFEVRDGVHNDFPDASFDRVWVLESSHLMRPRELLISECVRVLRPGGRIVLCDIVLRRPMPFEEVRRLRAPLGVLREVFGDAHMETLDRYEQLLRAAGAREVDVVDLSDATRPTFDRWRSNAGRHETEVTTLVGEGHRRLFIEAADILEGFWDDGTLGYGLVAAAK